MPLRRLVLALGVTQLVSWAALIYSIAVLGAAMGAELGVSSTAIFGAFSLSLAISGVAGPRVGRTIDRVGGRRVMSAGSLLGAGALFVVATAPNIAVFVLGWALAGLACAMTLYEAAFATLSQHTGAAFRRSVTAVTLLGGLASTASFPLSLLGLEHGGWRITIAGFAAAQLLICLPLHRWCIPAGNGGRAETQKLQNVASTAAPAAPTASAPAAAADVSAVVFVALATSFALTSFITSALAAHSINLLRATGLPVASAVIVASLIGPMQLAGRVLEFTIGRRYTSRTIGTVTLWLMVFSLVALALVDGEIVIAAVFAVAYGAANGVQTIIRGTVPAEIFGRDGYGHLIGRLSLASFVARAIAPLALTFPVAAMFGRDPSVPLLIGLALLALATYVIAVRKAARRRSNA